jgi:hypothetical protein
MTVLRIPTSNSGDITAYASTHYTVAGVVFAGQTLFLSPKQDSFSEKSQLNLSATLGVRKKHANSGSVLFL